MTKRFSDESPFLEPVDTYSAEEWRSKYLKLFVKFTEVRRDRHRLRKLLEEHGIEHSV